MGDRSRWHLRDEEPFVTIRAHPRRFAWGIPLVFAVSIGAGTPFAGGNLSLAIAIQLGLQTAGLLWLYVPVARRRWSGERERSERGDAPEPDPDPPRRGP